MDSDLRVLVEALENMTAREVVINGELKRTLIRYRKRINKPVPADCTGKMLKALKEIQNGIY